jgi:hypothetical protein
VDAFYPVYLHSAHKHASTNPWRVYSVEEDEIEERCDDLRQRLQSEMENKRSSAPRKGIKAHQVHELADAKIKESERLRSALRISKDYEEGSHWRKQEERLQNAVENGAKKEEK